MNKLLVEISKYQKNPAARRDAGVFVVEGPKMVREAPPERILILVTAESFEAEQGAYLKQLRNEVGKNGNVRMLSVSDAEFARISDTKTPQGILAVVRRFTYTLEEVVRNKNGVYVLLDAVQDPGNVGTIFRSAEAAGASGVLLNRESAEVYNPKVVRSTMGAIFRLPFLTVDDMGGTVKRLQDLGAKVYAAHLKGSVCYDEADFTGFTAILVGNESKGLSEEISVMADRRIRIPMLGKTESLNVAMASTVLLYESLRQRKEA